MMLARNSDVMGAVSAIEMLERKWNGDFGYPWVFLNDVEFDEEFKRYVSLQHPPVLLFDVVMTLILINMECRNVTAATKSQVYFGLIPKEHWEQPAWIDEEKARKGREDLVRQKMPYAGMSMSFSYYISLRDMNMRKYRANDVMQIVSRECMSLLLRRCG
jgi:alpha 1,2-mannosyltransferase